MTQNVGKSTPEGGGAPETAITPDMIAAGVAAIEPFDLQDAVEGYLGRDELVTAIFLAMVRAQERSA
jgi:hypothetical protein